MQSNLSFKYSTKHIQHLYKQIPLSLFTDPFCGFDSRPACLEKCTFTLTFRKGFIINKGTIQNNNSAYGPLEYFSTLSMIYKLVKSNMNVFFPDSLYK